MQVTTNSIEVTMSSTQMSNEHVTQVPTAATVDLKLEVVAIPVSDIDRAKNFYQSLGWTLDADFWIGKDFRAVQLTPPGSQCSIHLAPNAVPGSAQGMFLVVNDIEAARSELISHGVDVSGVFHFDGNHQVVPGADAGGRSYFSYASFADPDGNQWVLQEVKTRLPGRGLSWDLPTVTDLLREAEKRHGEYRTDRAEAPLVGMVWRLHRCAGTRPDFRRGRQGRDASHRRGSPRTRVEVGMRPFLSDPGRKVQKERAKQRTA